MSDFKSIDINQWKQSGEGASAVAYLNEDESQLLKINKHNATKEAAMAEFSRDQNVAAQGVKTAKVIEVVQVGDRFGLIYENIRHKKSYSRLVADNPEKIHEYAKLFAARTKELHSTPCNTDLYESRTTMIRKGVDKSKFLGKYKEGVYKLLDELPDTNTCLHGDLHTGNLIDTNGDDFWIDFDRFSYGNPIWDIAHMYEVHVSVAWFKYVQNLVHMDKKMLHDFWWTFIQEYYGVGPAEVDEINRKLEVYNAVELLQRNYIKPCAFSDLVTLILAMPKIVKYFKKHECK